MAGQGRRGQHPMVVAGEVGMMVEPLLVVEVGMVVLGRAGGLAGLVVVLEQLYQIHLYSVSNTLSTHNSASRYNYP